MKKHYLTLTLMFFVMLTANLLLAQTMHTVTIVDSQFQPANLTIDEGDIVTWVNQGSMVHTSTSGTNCNPDGVWDSGSLNSGQSFTFTFNNAGNFPYFCIPHCGIGMTGSISVTQGTSVSEINPSEQMELIFTGPNPFADETTLMLNLRKSTDLHIGLFDLLGNMVQEVHSGAMHQGENSIKLNGTNLKSGVYFLRLTAGRSILTYKAIKM